MIKLMQAFPCGAERSRSRALQYADSTFSSLEHADIRNSLNNYKMKYAHWFICTETANDKRISTLWMLSRIFSQPW